MGDVHQARNDKDVGEWGIGIIEDKKRELFDISVNAELHSTSKKSSSSFQLNLTFRVMQ